ncbi:hypothetical protein [Sporosalibacterium faouarense]|uniref:hypothetical protein n=1 Tax=Sporosalibacterium faouarense TaxID=516123 RepID=UPI001A9C5853|nr:hypothetical protein [Sporosalibacterium faouarense]
MFKFEGKISPKVVCEYYLKDQKEPCGYGLGISLMDKKKIDGDSINRIISGIKTIEENNINRILFDEYYILEKDMIKEIEGEYNLSIPNGREVLLKLLYEAISKVSKEANINTNEKEVLIIGKDNEATRKIILDLAKESKYISLIGNNEEYMNQIHNEALIETGLSIHMITSMNNSLGGYDFIINFDENPNIRVSDIMKKTIVFDISTNKDLSYRIRQKRRDVLVISDFILRNSKQINCSNSEFQLKEELSSNFYLGLGKEIYIEDLKKIRVGDKVYTVEQACDLFLSSKKKAANFYVKY